MDAIRSFLKAYGEQSPTSVAPLTQTLTDVRSATGVDFARSRVRAGFARGHLLDVTLNLPGGSGSAREQAAAEQLLRRLLGGLTFERWIGSLSVTPAPRGGALQVVSDASTNTEAIALEELGAAVLAAQHGLCEGLPGLPHARTPAAADWLLFELEPEPAHDYAAQDDLVLCTTSVPELKKSFLRAEPFFSGRFSKHGELFVYLKYEGLEQEPEARLAERGRFEAALDAALRPELGALVGAGFGLRYAYLDLALCAPERALAELPGILQAARVPKRSWLMFCDTELEREHVAIWPRARRPYFG